MRQSIIAGLLVLGLLAGCAGGGGSDEAGAEEPLTVCAYDVALVPAVRDAVALWQDDVPPPAAPRGMRSAAVTVAHELGHVLANRVDHVPSQESLMHEHHNPRQGPLTADDLRYVEGNTAVAMVEDGATCDITVRFGALPPPGVQVEDCPPSATGCQHGASVTLNDRYAWHVQY